MVRTNGNRFSVYTSEEKTVLGVINELAQENNEVIREIDVINKALEEKTDLYGDHKGTWQGLSRPTLSEEGMRAEVEDIIDNKIPSIQTSLDKKANCEYVNSQIALAQLEGASIDTTNLITRNDISEIFFRSINAFTGKNITKDKYLTRGNEESYVGWNITDYIRIEGNSMSCKIFKTADLGVVQGTVNTWVEVNNIYYAFYDSMYKYIGNSGSTDTGSSLNTVTIPTNAKYIRFSASNKIINDTSTLVFSFSNLDFLQTKDDYIKHTYEIINSNYVNNFELNKKLLNVIKSTTLRSINRLGYDIYNSDSPPEHSLEGYTLALEKGFDVLLCDLRSTSDSVPICIHDETINRTARNTDGTTIPTSMSVLNSNYNDLNRYDYGIFKGQKYKGTKLLTLERMVKFAKMQGVPLYIETKCGTTEKEMTMIENALKVVKKYNMLDNVTWSSSYGNKAVMEKLVQLDKRCNVALMPDEMTNDRFNSLINLKTELNKVYWFAWETSTLSDDMLDRFINNDIGIEIGTLNNVDDMKKLFDGNFRYVTGISSDKLVARECLK